MSSTDTQKNGGKTKKEPGRRFKAGKAARRKAEQDAMRLHTERASQPGYRSST